MQRQNLSRLRWFLCCFQGSLLCLNIWLIIWSQVTCVDHVQVYPAALSTQPIQALNSHTLATMSAYFIDNKRACGLSIQLREIPLTPVYQLAQLEKKKAIRFV